MSRVLIAEDEPALLESYRELVTGLGHDCIPARDGIEAVELARRNPPDLVVTDFMMPGKTGVEVVRALKADPVLMQVPTILMSAGRPPEAERREAWRFLAKPIGLDEFERAVEEGLKAASERELPKGFVASPPEETSPLSLAREQMLSWVAHEIKSPLSAAMLSCQLAVRGLRGAEDLPGIERRLLVITRQLTRMDELVSSILDAAQLEDGKLRLALEQIEVSEFLNKLVTFWKEIHPDFEFLVQDGKSTFIEADEERLRQTLDNLISNAIKYGQPSNVVKIDVASTDLHVKIAVTDQGRGIPPSDLPHIFDRFHRVAGHGGRGHGLGLYIAAALTRLHGGSLSVESEVGNGSTFTVMLPRKRNSD